MSTRFRGARAVRTAADHQPTVRVVNQQTPGTHRRDELAVRVQLVIGRRRREGIQQRQFRRENVRRGRRGDRRGRARRRRHVLQWGPDGTSFET